MASKAAMLLSVGWISYIVHRVNDTLLTRCLMPLHLSYIKMGPVDSRFCSVTHCCCLGAHLETTVFVTSGSKH